jgi:hypothetical protein
MNTSIKIVFGVFLFIVFAFIILLLLEIGYTLSGKYPIAGIQYNKETLWRWRANLNTISISDEFGESKLHTDSKGFRNADKSYKAEKDANVVRILVIGDSYTAGLAYPQDKIFTSLLEQNLNALASGKKVEVFNMASPAWGTEQEFLCLQNEGMSIKPDYVLLMTCPNDIRETYCKRYAELKDSRLYFNSAPFSAKEIIRWELANYSCFYQYLQRTTLHTDYGSFDFLMSKFKFAFGKEDANSWDRPVFLKNTFPEMDQAQALYDTLLTSMKQVCENNHAQFAVSCTPFIMEFDSTMKVDTALQPGIMQQRIGEFCSRADIPFINLYKRFALQADPSGLFTKSDLHFSAKGFEVTGAALTEFYKDKIKK